MKRNFLIIIALMLSTTIRAQDRIISWNIKAGMNISNFVSVDDAKSKIGFRGGIGIDVAFTEMWSVQPSIMFTSKGGKIETDMSEEKINAWYLELPIMGAARFHVAENASIVLSAGPYIAVGIGGKTTINLQRVIEDEVSTFGGERANRFDTGVGLGAALEYRRFILAFEAQLGLIKVMDVGDKSPKNLNFAISLGYRFW